MMFTSSHAYYFFLHLPYTRVDKSAFFLFKKFLIKTNDETIDEFIDFEVQCLKKFDSSHSHKLYITSTQLGILTYKLSNRIT